MLEHLLKDRRVAAVVSQDRKGQGASRGNFEALQVVQIPIPGRQRPDIGAEGRARPGQETQDKETELEGGKSL